MKSDIKPYQIELYTHYTSREFTAIGHFIKEPYFVIEQDNGDRTLMNNAEIIEIIIDKEWLSDD